MLQTSQTLCVVAAFCAILSIPLPWLTSHTIHLDATNLDHQIKAHAFTHLSGTNGALTAFLTIPFWTIATLIAFVSFLILARQRGRMLLPRYLVGALIFAAICLVALVPFFTYTTGGSYHPDTGWLLALCGTIVAAIANRDRSTSTPAEGG